MDQHCKTAKIVSALLTTLLLGTGCSKGFTSLELGTEGNNSQSSSSSSIWGQGQYTPLSAANNAMKPTNASCYIYVADGLNRDEELRVRIYSTDMWQVQVAVGDSDFFDLGATNGTLTWAGNSFPAGAYLLRFRGVTPEGHAIACTPGAKVVTIYDNPSTPVPVPTPVPTPAPTPVPPVVVNPPSQPSQPTPPTTPTVPSEDKRNYKSLHSYPIRVAKKPAEGSYNYEFYSYTGFKNQYNPNDSMTGCLLGIIPAGQCAFPWTEPSTISMSFTEAMIGYNVPRNLRFFVTAGSSDVRMAGYAAQRQAFAFVIKMGSAPTRTRAITAAEYSAAQVNERIDTSYARLAAGEEMIVVHDGGGTLRFLSGKTVTNGGWVYIRQLDIGENISGMTPAANLYDIQLAVVADKASFIQHYQRMNFDASGDPE